MSMAITEFLSQDDFPSQVEVKDGRDTRKELERIVLEVIARRASQRRTQSGRYPGLFVR